MLLPDEMSRPGKLGLTDGRTPGILSPPSGLALGIFSICLAFGAMSAGVAAQFASGVNLVEVYATVLNDKGEPVPNLPAEAFVVKEDGVPQPVQVFSAGELPLALAIAVDRSFSVPAARLENVTAAVQQLLGELRLQDQTMLLAIWSEVEEVTPLSTDHRAAYDAVGALHRWGTTPLHDAIVAAIDRIQHASGRRALILISDGGDRYSDARAADVIAIARARDVLVYPIALGRTASPMFAEVASVTGGHSFAVRDERTLPATLRTIVRELRTQYLLGYEPADRGVASGWRRISVDVLREGLHARARDGYVAP